MNKRVLCLFVVIVLALAVMQEVGAKQKKTYRSIEDKIEAEGSADVIIRLSTQADQKVQKSARTMDRNLEVLKERNILEKEKELKIINAYSGELTKAGLREIKNLEKEGYKIDIYEDRIFHLDATQAENPIVEAKNGETNSKSEEGSIGVTLDNSVPSIEANYSWNTLDITGRNITVAVIDSGIDYNHTDLGGCFGPGCRIIDGFDFVNNDSDPYDDYGHGTHVAGIIGANGTIMGVAPGVEFLAVKACDSVGDCALSDIIESIEWATNNGADIISMSLGGSYSDVIQGNTGKDSTSLAAEAAVASGKIVVVAGGNHGPGISTLAVPGASENMITVGNIDDQGTIEQTDDVIATSSGRGPSAFGRLDPDVVAPGQLIYSTYPDNDYQTMSGTSMATPHVSGVIALMLEQNSSLTPSEVRKIIMQTAVNVSGKAFEVGAGEINARNALTNELSAIVEATNSYGQSATNDRWEFISPITGTEYANITIYNSNDYDINFTLLLTNFENLENSVTLDSSQFMMPESVTVPANDFYLIEVNFTVDNFTELYATTYGGKLTFLGNDSKNLTIPIVVTVPIKNYANLIRTLTYSGGSTGDVLYYAYYNAKAGDEEIKITWNNDSTDLDLYVYNSTADLDNYGGYFDTNNESVTTNLSDTIKWFRIHGYSFSPTPFNFTINITDNGNIAPNITSVTNEQGAENFNFSLSQNITLIFYYTSTDNDTLTYTFNDSRYTETVSSVTNHTYNSTYTLNTNTSLLGNHTVRFTVQDEYGAITYRDVLVKVYDVQIDSFYPANLTQIVRKNSTINFSQTSSDPGNNTLYYYWYIDGVLNTTDQNFTLDTTGVSSDYYNVTFRVTNNLTNATKTWNVTIDQYGPTLTIVQPNGTVNTSIVPIRFNVSDISGHDDCWYMINNSEQNITINSCNSTTHYLLNGSYRIFLYSNDSFGFISSINNTFTVVDTTSPVILSTSPSGTIDFTDEVTLKVNLDENSTCKYSQDDESYDSMNNLFDVIGTINNTETYNVQGGENYEVYVKCKDMAGNINNGTNLINFTVEEEDSGGGGSSGGGSSTGGTTTGGTTTSNSNRYGIFIIEATDNITINVNSQNISLKYLFIKIFGTKRNIDMSIIQHNLDALPSAGNLFPYNNMKNSFIEIKHTNLADTDVENVKLRFKVLNSWINANSIDINTLKIYRYSDSWNELPTTIYTQDFSSVTLEAVSPGLSYFIVAGEQKIQMPTMPENNNEITGDQVLVRKDVTQEKPLILNDPLDTQAGDGNKNPFTTTVIIILVISVIITVVGVDLVVIRNKKIAAASSKEEQINNLKKQYQFEGNQIIQEYKTRLRMMARDPMIQQKAILLKQGHDQMIMQLHNKYVALINQVKNSK